MAEISKDEFSSQLQEARRRGGEDAAEDFTFESAVRILRSQGKDENPGDESQHE